MAHMNTKPLKGSEGSGISPPKALQHISAHLHSVRTSSAILYFKASTKTSRMLSLAFQVRISKATFRMRGMSYLSNGNWLHLSRTPTKHVKI